MNYKIGLVGVPGSGKTAFAHTLNEALKKHNDTEDDLTIIDRYVDDVNFFTGLATGFDGGYLVNANIALERTNRERRYAATGYITCGTLLETATYTVQDMVPLLQYDDEAERQDSIKRIESVMKFYSCLYMDTFKYDHVFYLPPVNVPEEGPIKELDFNLQAAFNAFDLVKVVPLLSEEADPVEHVAEMCLIAMKHILGEDDESTD